MPPRAPQQRPPQEQPPPPNRTREYLLKGLGLVLVAVVSGMLWWLIQQGNRPQQSDNTAANTQQPQGKFQFTKNDPSAGPILDSNCEEHSYQKVKEFFAGTKCVGLTRQLYTTTVDGKKTYTSVSVVRMGNAQDAAALKALTEKSGTGNVSDLVREGRPKVAGLKSLSDGGFAAGIQDADVIIVESDYEGGSKNADEARLDEVSADAVRLGEEMRRQS
jgi:hypothetical protein